MRLSQHFPGSEGAELIAYDVLMEQHSFQYEELDSNQALGLWRSTIRNKVPAYLVGRGTHTRPLNRLSLRKGYVLGLRDGTRLHVCTELTEKLFDEIRRELDGGAMRSAWSLIVAGED